MDTSHDIKNLAENPEFLLQTIRDLVKYLDSLGHSEEIKSMEAQLREISRAVEKLEKIGVEVPNAFRAEKTRLVAELSIKSESIIKLTFLLDSLEVITRELKTLVGRGADVKVRKRSPKFISDLPKTENKILRNLIIQALKELGGSARKKEVLNLIEEKYQENFLPGDLEWRTSAHEFVWKNNAAWERYEMVQDGIIQKGSTPGLWELTTGYS